MSKTKIVVLQLKEIVYTAIFVALGILLILLLVFMFADKKSDGGSTASKTAAEEAKYVAGVYTSSIKLSENTLNLEVIVDESHINSVRLLNLDETISTMYPVVEPGLAKIEEQLVSGVNVENLEYEADCQYTQMLLVTAIETALSKASISPVPEN